MKQQDDYESCYCPENLDSDNPQNWIRKNYVIPFREGLKPPYPSDADLYTTISKKIVADFDLDNHDLGVYLRLNLFEYFGYSWSSIFNFGEENVINDSLNRLHEKGYIYKLTDGTIKTRNI